MFLMKVSGVWSKAFGPIEKAAGIWFPAAFLFVIAAGDSGFTGLRIRLDVGDHIEKEGARSVHGWFMDGVFSCFP